MDLAEIRTLKKKIIDDVYKPENGKVSNAVYAGRFQTTIEEALKRPEKRMSVGYSKGKNGNFKIELLVDRENQQAHNAAIEIQKNIGEDKVNIEVIATSYIPTKSPSEDPPSGSILYKRIEGPLHIGLSVSHKELNAGSLGAFVLDDKNQICILSCNHVLADNGSNVEKKDSTTRRIYHPGNTPDAPVIGKDHIGQLEGWVELKRTQANSSDSAYASLLDDIEYLGNVVPLNIGASFEGEKIYQAPADFIPIKGQKVYKIGCYTGFTTGIIDQISIDRVTVKGGGKNYMFDNIIKINWLDENSPFSLPGDSGGLAFMQHKGKLIAIGIVFAGMPNNSEMIRSIYKQNMIAYSYVCILKDILRHNNLTFLET